MSRFWPNKTEALANPVEAGRVSSLHSFLRCGLDPQTADPSLLRQVLVLNSLMLTALLLCIPLGIFWSALATPLFAIVYTCCFVVWGLLVVWLHHSLRTVIIGRIACCVLFGLCTASVILLGESGSSMLSWFLLMPLASAVCVGRRDLWVWGLIASATPAIFFFLPAGVLFEAPPLHPEVERQFSGIVLALGALVASILTGIWIAHHEGLAQRLDNSVARLKKEAQAHRLLIDTAMLASGEAELKAGARTLLEHLAKLDWVSTVSFWDTRENPQPLRPFCTLPVGTRSSPSPSLARAVRTGERAMSREHDSQSHSACYPIKDREEVVGVIEISTDEAHDPVQEGGWLLQQIAIQLGHIAERERTAELIQREARFDSLTSLPNRRAFEDLLAKDIRTAQIEEHDLALLFLDLNGFKRINDSLGHAAGDEVLQVVARRLTSTVRQADIKRPSRDRAVDSISRVGGDEFTVVLSNVSTTIDADTVAQRIIDALAAPIRLQGQQFTVGVSIGIATYPQDAQDADVLIRFADDAMYKAKSRGRSGFCHYQASENSVDSLSLEAEMRAALAQDQLEMHYQPVFSCTSGDVIGAEALIRWRHPERGWISPTQFIPFAEKTNLIGEIGHFQFEAVLKWFESSYTELPENFRIALNLSPTQIEDPSFVSWLTARLADSHLPMNQLELEITETALLADTPEARDNVDALASLGICITLDDFGTGQSSLSLLKRFRIGRLKIDRSFVSGLPDRNEDAAIVSAVLSLAQSLEIPVVAEGVENETQQLFLLNRGCDDMQGFLLARPMQGDVLIQRLKETQVVHPIINFDKVKSKERERLAS